MAFWCDHEELVRPAAALRSVILYQAEEVGGPSNFPIHPKAKYVWCLSAKKIEGIKGIWQQLLTEMTRQALFSLKSKVMMQQIDFML